MTTMTMLTTWAISALLRHRFPRFAVTGVHTYLISLRFQKFPLWRAFSKVCGYSVRFRRTRVDESRIRNKMFADTNKSGYVWTGPEYRKIVHSTGIHFSHMMWLLMSPQSYSWMSIRKQQEMCSFVYKR